MNSLIRDRANAVRQAYGNEKKLVFVSGDFNVVHPGHLRLFDFASGCGDVLIVGVNRQGHGNTVLSEALRLESVKSVSVVDECFVLPSDPEDFIAELQPDVVVKGKEHETRHNPELPIVEGYGGKLLFSSGDVRFSSIELLLKELNGSSSRILTFPKHYPQRHEFTRNDLAKIVEKFGNLNVVVIGDLIIDEYITCDALGMSQEDPTLVVTPLKHDRFVGGAGIVAAHARSLGAKVSYLGVTGNDDAAGYAREKLSEYGVAFTLLADENRPTSLKQRFRAQNKTLLRVSHMRQDDIDIHLAESLYEQAKAKLDGADLLVFSDFNYGCLPQGLVEKLKALCDSRGIMMVADSQASSQMADVSRFKGMALITPTEREARLATRINSAGLVVLADALRAKAGCENVVITLAAEGILVHAPQASPDKLITDRLPAFNTSPKDVAGAGDSLLVGTGMALAVGSTIWQATYLGSVIAGIQVGSIGNRPIKASTVLEELRA
jgi:rfaE bifunctional protein kinase chain/domain